MNYTEQTVIEELKNLMKTLNIQYLPVKGQMCLINGLANRVTRVGGSKYLSNKYNISLKQNGYSRKITDDEIKQLILKVVGNLKLERFQTRDEMNNNSGNNSLSGLVSKRGGFVKWSKIMNLPMKESETLTGYKGEAILKEIIESKGYKIARQTANCFYDFIVEDYIRVECKYSHLYHGINGNFYAFNLETKMHDCDLYVCVCEDDSESRQIIIIPQSILQGQAQISIGEHRSKWYEYVDRYDLIDKYKNFYTTLI